MGRGDVGAGPEYFQHQREAHNAVVAARPPSTITVEQARLVDDSLLQLQKALAASGGAPNDRDLACAGFLLRWYKAFWNSDAFDVARALIAEELLDEVIQSFSQAEFTSPIRLKIQETVLFIHMSIADRYMVFEHFTGQGSYQYLDGRSFFGAIVNGVPDGFGTLFFSKPAWSFQGKYVGQVKGGHPEGAGRIEYEDGSVYDGGFVNGRKEGMGRLTYPNQKSYDGAWVNDLPEGRGRLTQSGGMIIEASFAAGEPVDGRARLIRPDGKIVDGRFHSGDFHPD